MIQLETVVIDIEAFCHKDQAFIFKEISVRGPSYHDTILLKPPYTSYLIPQETQKTYNFLTKHLHGLRWESGTYDYSFIYSFFTSLKIRFPNIIVYTKGLEKCKHLLNFFNNVINLEDIGCPTATQFDRLIIPNC